MNRGLLSQHIASPVFLANTPLPDTAHKSFPLLTQKPKDKDQKNIHCSSTNLTSTSTTCVNSNITSFNRRYHPLWIKKTTLVKYKYSSINFCITF